MSGTSLGAKPLSLVSMELMAKDSLGLLGIPTTVYAVHCIGCRIYRMSGILEVMVKKEKMYEDIAARIVWEQIYIERDI